MNMNERDLEKLSKAKLIKMVEKLQNKARKPTEKPSNLVEKLQNKARKPKIAIIDDDNGQVPQPQKPTGRIPPRDPKTGCFVKSIQVGQNHQSNPPYQGYGTRKGDLSRDDSHNQ